MEKSLNIIARILSGIFSPLLMGTYAMILALWISYLNYTPMVAKLTVLSVTLIATCVIPVITIFVLWKAGIIKDPRLNTGRERLIPYMVATAGFIAVCVYSRIVNAPLWLTMFYAGATLAMIIDTTLTGKWKISGHATGMGGLCAILFYMMISAISVYPITVEFLCAVLAAGLVCTSRLILERHDIWQILAGFANGFICTLVPTLLFT